MNLIWKKAALVTGILALVACFMIFPFGLAWLFSLVENTATESKDAIYLGMAWWSASALFLGGGLTLAMHALNSLGRRTSRPFPQPPLWILFWSLPLILVLGSALYRSEAAGLLFPAVFVIAAGLPPLTALAWAGRDLPEPSWRQVSVAIVLGASFSVVLAIFLEILLPGFFFVLVQGLFESLRASWQSLVEGLAGGEVAEALGSSAFIFALIQLALFAPLAEELAKPLFCLPIIRQVETERQAFLIGAAAGAGFAALENMIYTGFGVNYWSGVLVLRTIGAGIHPLGSGLVALGWYRYLRPDQRVKSRAVIQGNDPARGASPIDSMGWIHLFAIAFGVHALWNGGSLLFIALVGANFFGNAPQVDLFGISVAGALLALLSALGAGAFIAVSAIARSLPGLTPLDSGEKINGGSGFLKPEGIPLERAIAIWALLCLIIALPLGLAALMIHGGLP